VRRAAADQPEVDALNHAALGAHQQHAIRLERDVILEELPARGRGLEPGGDLAGLDLCHQHLAIALDQIIGTHLHLARHAVDERRPPGAHLPADDRVPGAPQQRGGLVLTRERATRTPLRAPGATQPAQPPREQQGDQRTREDEHERFG